MLSILLIAAGAILETLFIMQSYRRRNVASIILKTTASLLFVLLGIHCTRLRGQSVYALYVVIGLALGMLGDLLLALRYLSKKTHDLCFVSGTLAFFVLTAAPRAWTYAIPITLVALAVAGFYSHAMEVKAGKIMPLGVIYIGCVIFVAACSLTGVLLTSDRALFMFFLGGLCFSLSDNMLVVLSFGRNDSPYRNAVLHVLYYMAQIFIALSILFYTP